MGVLAKAADAAREIAKGAFGSFGGFGFGDEGRRSHRSASRDAALDTWLPGWGSADSDARWDRDLSRERARDLDRNESVANSYLNEYGKLVAPGRGLLPNPRPDYVALGWDKAKADRFAAKLKRLSHGYLLSPNVDATRFGSVGQLQRLTLRSRAMNGGVILLPIWKEDPRYRYATCFQLVEYDRLSTPAWGMDRIDLRNGIEVDAYGEPLAYHIARFHPGDMGTMGYVQEWVRVPATTVWGRPLVLHCFKRDRVGQSSGLTDLSVVMTDLKAVNDYKGAEIRAAVVNAMVAMLVESQGTMEDVTSMFEDPEAYWTARKKHNAGMKMRHGAILSAFPGDKLNSFLPARPNPQAVAFLNAIRRDVATGLGLPLEAIDKNWSGLNYSQTRTVLLDVWRTVDTDRTEYADCVCQPCHELWFEEAVALGDFAEFGVDLDFLYEPGNRQALTRCVWIGSGKGYIDPVKEISASQARVAAGMSTLEHECAEQGTDWRENADQQAVEAEYYHDRGMPYPGLGHRAPILMPADVRHGAPGVTDAGLLPLAQARNDGLHAPREEGTGGSREDAGGTDESGDLRDPT